MKKTVCIFWFLIQTVPKADLYVKWAYFRLYLLPSWSLSILSAITLWSHCGLFWHEKLNPPSAGRIMISILFITAKLLICFSVPLSEKIKVPISPFAHQTERQALLSSHNILNSKWNVKTFFKFMCHYGTMTRFETSYFFYRRHQKTPISRASLIIFVLGKLSA